MDDAIKERAAWFEDYTARVDHGVVKAANSGTQYTCPCCGYPTLDERGGYEICPLCNWEDEGQDDPHADEVWGGPNGRYSLTEARENFKKSLIMFGDNDPRIGGADSALEKQAKESMIEVFEKMRGVNDSSELAILWSQVNQGRAILYQETLRKTREFEKQYKK